VTNVTDLIHRRTRNAFRETCSDAAVVRQIEQAFANEGFEAADDQQAGTGGWYSPGQRRGTFDRYSYGTDWSDPRDVRRILGVFEEILSWLGTDNEFGIERRAQLARHLEQDGYPVDDSGRIRSSVLSTTADLNLAGLRLPAAIMEHLDRIAAAMDTDVPVAISGAKALVEATTKTVLHELGETYDERADVPALVKAAQKALQLDPSSLAPSAKGVETTKRILSNLSQVAIGIAELRNEYGPDHGRTTPTFGLGPRHAHLAVGSAMTYCRMLLETLDARRTRALSASAGKA
jgi:antitoxin component of MazEF toxin-antitoxin module